MAAWDTLEGNAGLLNPKRTQMSGMQMTLPACNLTPFIQGPTQQTIIKHLLCALSSLDIPQLAYMPEHSNLHLNSALIWYVKENQKGSPPPNNTLCYHKHFCVFFFLVAMDFQGRRLIFIPLTLFLFIIPCKISGITELC